MTTRRPRRLGMAVNHYLDRPEAEFLTAIRRVRAAGMTGIELNTPDPDLIDHLAVLIRAEQLELMAIATGRMACHDGASPTAGEVLSRAAAAAERHHAKLVVGLIRGRASLARDLVERFLRETLGRILVVHPHIQVVIEPIAAREAAWPNTLADGLDCLDRFGWRNEPRIKLLADAFHLVPSGEMDQWEAARPWIGHVQIAGPARAAPPLADPAIDAQLAQALRFAADHGLDCGFELAANATDEAERCAAWAASVLAE
ncbi:hypothetical protein LBMAG53_08450 [Planctomycetota bacterium]|nr:hypothetical protein LBMAG53_08450 [Planctomycetota bacterium]